MWDCLPNREASKCEAAGVMERNDIVEPNFKGFMADCAQANWNVVRIIYGNGKKEDRMDDRERTCHFTGRSPWLSIPRSTFLKNSGSSTRRCATNI